MPIFYHVTDNKNIKSIMKKGLLHTGNTQDPNTVHIDKLLDKHLKNYKDDILDARNNAEYLIAENMPDFKDIRKTEEILIVDLNYEDLYE